MQEIAYCKELSADLIDSVEKRTPALIAVLKDLGSETHHDDLEHLKTDLGEYDS